VSRAAPIRLRTLAFGDLDAGLWGFALGSLDDPQLSALIGTIDRGTRGATSPLTLSVGSAGTGEPLRVTAEGAALTFIPAEGSPAVLSSVDGAEALVELGSVRGTVRLDGIELDVDCLGQRGTRVLGLGLGELDSLREVMAWFGPGDALALTSLRPRRTKGHDRDLATTVLLEDGCALPVQEPRLSTTYAPDGAPARASLEMWLEEPEPVQGDDSEELIAQHFPRRAAGERVGPATRLGAAGLEVQAEPFRWHMRGLEGTGVYALARPL
jgi:hypothetical protein